jgi:outer membrane autotransporter protein
MPCGVLVGMTLGLWNAHVNAQQVNVGVNVQLLDQYLIDACVRLRLAGGQSSSSSSSASSGPILSAGVGALGLTLGQADLLTRCANIQAASEGGQNTALDQVNPTDFNAIKLDTLTFSDSTNTALSRMRDLRQDHKGTISRMDLRYNDMPLLATSGIAADAQHRGGGASADSLAVESPWGIWGRINHASGDKDATALSGPMDMTHSEYTLGMDYHTAASVLGLSVGLRNADVDFGAHGERGGLDGRTTTVSVYASSYLIGDLYVDGIINYGLVSYDTTRRITYNESGTVIDRTALGSVDGKTLNVAGSLGYDLASGPFTVTPSLGYFYIKAKVDPFAEQGAAGLDLAFSEQRYRSSSARLQLNGSYAININRAVLLPYVRAAWVKEFKDEADSFDVRFVGDPDAAAGVPVGVEALDNSYYRLALGMSAQFHRELSAYFDYQVLSGFQSVSLWSASAGLRKQF